MTGKWVCKPDGRIQCQDNPEIPLDTMRKQLAAVVGDDNILDQKKITVITPKMCGIPAGTMNAYDLSEFGYELLHNGFVGPMGFRDCPGDGQHAMPGVTDQAGTEPNFATGVAFTGISSAGSTPTLVRDLIGHRVRVYEQGSPVTLDLIFGRVNVVTKDHVIADIWFG